jgi:hypothetical protein
MRQQNKDSDHGSKKPDLPQTNDLLKQEQREKAEQKEIAGRHKNDGQKDHKGRR